MSSHGELILQCLQEVDVQRQARAADPALAIRVERVKRFQRLRFERTYADLLDDPRYAPAVRFFLSDLYGPGDFTRRDDEFARIVPPLVRLFPQDIVNTVLALAQLHALSEQLDSAMAGAIGAAALLDGAAYAQAWRSVARKAEREAQIGLMVTVGHALDRHTRSALLRHSAPTLAV